MHKLNRLFVVAILLLFTGMLAQTNAQSFAVGDTVFTMGFEAGADSNGVPIGAYGPIDWGGNGSVTLIDSVTVHSGNYSATIYNPDTSQTVNCSMDVLTSGLEKNAEYHLTIWIKTEITAGDAQIITQWDNARLIHATGITDWTQYEMDFTAPGGDMYIRLHMQDAKGRAWYDDMVIVKTKDAPHIPTDSVANPGFELPNDEGNAPAYWYPEPWGSGDVTIGPPSCDSCRYVWDNTVAHSGNYSGKLQFTQASVNQGWDVIAWLTKNLEFKSGGIYDMSYWVKTKNFGPNGEDYICLNIGYNNTNLTRVTTNTDWIQVHDTILFPTDQDDNYWRNEMRFRLAGYVWSNDSLPQAWIDDVEFKLLGFQSVGVDSIVAVRNADNSIDLTWPAPKDVSNPIYHVLVQPYDSTGNYANNLLDNPGVEIPNSDGSAPEGWDLYIDTWAGQVGPSAGEYPADQTYQGNFSLWLGETDPSDDRGIYTRWETSYDKSKLKMNQAYLYGAMVNYENVVALQDSIVDPRAPMGYYYDCGLVIFYDRYVFEFQNEQLISLGWSTPVGTSNGWEQIFLPLPYGQAAPRHHIGIGLGQYWGGRAHGSLYIDNAFVVPFDEVGTTTETTYHIDNFPEKAKYVAVYVEDPSGQLQDSPAMIGLVKMATAIDHTNTVARKFELKQNYPNPFNPTTFVRFSIPERSKVKLTVYDILGRKVMDVIHNKQMAAGSHLVKIDGSRLASGLYFYKLQTKNHTAVKKMLLIK